MTKQIMTCHQPMACAGRDRRRNAVGGVARYLCPRVYSMIRSGMPAVSSATRYGMRNAPPPFW